MQRGYAETRDFILDVVWADGEIGRLSTLAEDLATRRPDVVVTAITAAAEAAKRAMAGVPIVSATLIDPIQLGLVKSYARPGGTVTGILFSLAGLVGKQLQLALEVKPRARRIGMLVNMSNPSNVLQRKDAESAQAALGLQLLPIEVAAPAGIDNAFETLKRERCDFVLVFGDAVFVTERRRIAALAAAAGMPLMGGLREFAEAGALVTYGIGLRESWRRAAYFVDRILKGAKVDELPVETPTHYELIVNLKTAGTLGMKVPQAVLARADEVIQ